MQRLFVTSATCAFVVFTVSCSDENAPHVNTTDTGPQDVSPDTRCPASALGQLRCPQDDVAADTDAGDDVGPMTDQERIEAVELSEQWQLPDLDGPVHVVRTEMGVPHIFAASRHDLGVALGFVLARDRFFIMDLQRRLALGRISALIGDLGLDADIDARQTGMTYVSQRLLDNMDDETAAFIDAYVMGVNRYIELVQSGDLPPPSELVIGQAILGDPAEIMQPFDRLSVAAMAAVIMYQTNFDTSDVRRQAKFDALADAYDDDAALVDLRRAGLLTDLWFPLLPEHPYASASGWTVDGASEKTRLAGPHITAPPTVTRRLRQKRLPAQLSRRTVERLARIDDRLGRRELENFGSNTWAVAGSSSADGNALVAGDGHLQLDIPALMFQVSMNTKLFGGGDLQQSGLIITSLPVLGVGTNGDIAWSQVNPVSDITDWYREEIRLDDDGVPIESFYDGQWRPLVRVDEQYDIAAIPLLGSEGRTETWTRFETADGRFVFDIEGRLLGPEEEPAPDEFVMATSAGRVVPGDEDGDDTITAVSFDYTAFDATQYIGVNERLARARDVYEYQEASKGLIGNMLYVTVADKEGNIFFTSYQAVPCRNYLPRDGEGRWQPGANPTQLLDGTLYPSFSIPSNPDGTVNEEPGQTDPTRCVVPFDVTPQAFNPPSGYLVNANNQPAPITDDGRLDDDPYYIGGPWSEFRADSISTGLEDAIADGGATLDDMAAIQGNVKSRVGELLTPFVAMTLEHVQTLQAGGELTESEQRLVDFYEADSARIDEAAVRLQAWGESGYWAASGVETFYNPAPGDQDRADAVATMIFNAWLPRFVRATFGDENVDPWRFLGFRAQIRAVARLLRGRGDDNPGELASWDPTTGESVYFDVLDTAVRESSHEVLLRSLVEALDWLEADPIEPGLGGFGTNDMDQWLWGLRHQVRFESIIAAFLPPDSAFSLITDVFAIDTRKLPLAENLPSDDPRRNLTWFPRPGDNYAVDAASTGGGGSNFTYGSGPVMRMVISIGSDGVRGRNIIPGGQSGLNDSPHFADQAALWLGNDTVPMYYTPREIADAGLSRELLTP